MGVTGESNSLLVVLAAEGIGAKPTNGRLPAGPKRSGVADSPARRGCPKKYKQWKMIG